MATEKIVNSTKVKSGGFTPSGSINASTLIVKQSGQVVHIGGYLTNVPVGSNVRLGIFSGIGAPPTSIRSLCGVANLAYQHPDDVAYITIGTDLSFSITSNASGTKAVYFNITYITND